MFSSMLPDHYQGMPHPRLASAVGYAPLPVYLPPTLRGTWVLKFEPEYGPYSDVNDPTKPVYEMPDKPVQFPPVPTPAASIPGGSPYNFTPRPSAPARQLPLFPMGVNERVILAINNRLNSIGKRKYFTIRIKYLLDGIKRLANPPSFIILSGLPLLGLPERFDKENTQPIDVYILPNYNSTVAEQQTRKFKSVLYGIIPKKLDMICNNLYEMFYYSPRESDTTEFKNLMGDPILPNQIKEYMNLTLESNEISCKNDKFVIRHEDQYLSKDLSSRKYTLYMCFHPEDKDYEIPLLHVTIANPHTTFYKMLKETSKPQKAQFIQGGDFIIGGKPSYTGMTQAYLKETSDQTSKSLLLNLNANVVNSSFIATLSSSPQNDIFKGFNSEGKVLINTFW